MEVNDSNYEPESVIAAAKCAESALVPGKSKSIYNKAYDDFLKWKLLQNAKTNSETVLMAYFYDLSLKFKPTSMWASYSMLKSMMKLNDNIDISSYHKLTAFLKNKSSGCKPVKAKVFSVEEIEKFISNANDSEWLDVKVACIFAISGALRTNELTNITVADIGKHDRLWLVQVVQTKTKVSRSFTITGKFYDVVEKYAGLRCPTTVNPRFFVNCRWGKCTNQVIGKEKFSKMPQRIARYLELPEPQLYTGHSFRRSSASALANSGASMERIKRHGGWRSSTVAEGYIENSLYYKKKTGDLITSTITSATVTASQGYMNHVKEDSDDMAVELQDFISSCTSTASQGFISHVTDDFEIPFDEIPDFTSAAGRQTLQRSDNGSDTLQDTINPLRPMDPLIVAQLENRIIPLETNKSNVSKAGLQDVNNQSNNRNHNKSFVFHDCSITFHVR